MFGGWGGLQSAHVHLYLVFYSFDVHDSAFEFCVLVQKEFVDFVQFRVNRYLHIVEIVHDLNLQAFHLLGNSNFLSLYLFLAVAEMAVLILQQVMDLLGEQFKILHHVPEVLRVHGGISGAIGAAAGAVVG